MRHQRCLRHAGFTLIEAVVAMSVVSILAGIALPALQNVGEAARSGAAKGTLVESWMTSVAHAANTGSEVVLCPGDGAGIALHKKAVLALLDVILGAFEDKMVDQFTGTWTVFQCNEIGVQRFIYVIKMHAKKPYLFWR